MKRILILGSSGAGKSTLARKLSARLGLPVVSLDHLFWKPGWQMSDNKTFVAQVLTQTDHECWIMEGNFSTNTIVQRLKRADAVIYLDFNRWLCAWRVIKRWLRAEGVQAPGCPQKVDLEFLKYVLWDYPQSNRKRYYLDLMKKHADTTSWITLKGSRDVQRWLATWPMANFEGFHPSNSQQGD